MRSHFEDLPRLLPRLLVLLVVMNVAAGCGIFSPDESKEPPVNNNPFPLAIEPDVLVSNFERAYEERNFSEYENLVHLDFVFYFAVEDVDLSPGGQGFWERADEIQSTEAMFGGQEGLKENGEVQPSIQSITIQLDPVEPTWTDASGDGAEFVGSLKRRYEVDMTVEYTAGDIISSVQGQQTFYVKAETRDVNGVPTDVYQLYAWRDLGNPLGKVTTAGL